MLKPVLTILLFLIASSAFAHPYEGAPTATPKKFILHQTEDGRPIHTNIPKRCFSQGRLICHQLHPVFQGSGTIKKPEN